MIDNIPLQLILENSLREYDLTLSFTILGTKKPFAVSFAHRLIMVLFVTPSSLLNSTGVNSSKRFCSMNFKKSFSLAFKCERLFSISLEVDELEISQTFFEYNSIILKK